MKKQNALDLSDYTDIWKVLIMHLLSSSIIDTEPHSSSVFATGNDFSKLRTALDDYQTNAFAPEFIRALKLVENSEKVIEYFAKHSIFGLSSKSNESLQRIAESNSFQSNLHVIENAFKESLENLKLQKNHTLFVDGIDIRPESVGFSEYLDCVKGLANAVWELNNDFFPSIRDSRGRMKVVALLRPDIFNSVGLQNRNTKLRDNSVVLDWRTRYKEYRESDLFKLADRLLSAQQISQPEPGSAWDYYFPFSARTTGRNEGDFSAFITVLRYSFHRPRDILSVLDILDELYVRTGKAQSNFTYDMLTSREFRRAYGAYMLGEIKDSLSFYYTEEQYQIFLKFFEYLDGNHRFDFGKFVEGFADFMKFVEDQNLDIPDFMGSAEELLQFLYDQNILCYIEQSEDEPFIRWCFIERSPSNISPKVKLNQLYEIHYGLANALNTGKKFKKKRDTAIGGVVKATAGGFFEGNVKFIQSRQDYGFIIQDGMPVDIFFHVSRIVGGVSLSKGMRVRFRLEKDDNGRLMAVDVMPIRNA